MRTAIAIVAKDIDINIIHYYAGMIRNVFVITPEISPELNTIFSTVTFFRDEDILDKNCYPKLAQTKRPNWYFQQFLKYCAVLKINKEFGYDLVHIVDGDTYVQESLLQKEILPYTSKKIEIQYQNFISAVFPHLKDDKNFITNQMGFNALYLEEMLQNAVPDNDWINLFIEIIIHNEECWFSEYQLYACYVKYYRKVEETPIKVFRRFDLLKQITIESALGKYQVVAQETNHSDTVLHYLRALLYYSLGKNLG